MTTSPAPASGGMDDKTALHTTARRFCEDRFTEWIQIYEELQVKENFHSEKLLRPGWDYSDDAYRVFPRYRADRAIQVEVERLAPPSTEGLEELRVQLLRACDVAEARLRAEFRNEVAHSALQEEAHDYKTYIRTVNVGDLINVAPLPFRRVLNNDESKGLWNQLKLAWNIGESHWFPLREGPMPANAMAFHTDYFKKMHGLELLREAFDGRGNLPSF